MDHNHETGQFRNIVCRKCNFCKSDKKFNTNTGERFIFKVKSKSYIQGFYYQIKIKRNGKWVLNKTKKNLKDAIELRDKFLAENPNLFT